MKAFRNACVCGIAGLLLAPVVWAAPQNGPAIAELPAAGQLRFVVRARDTGEPVANASVFLDDPTGTERRRNLITGPDGMITSNALPAHEWEFVVVHPRFQKYAGRVTVPPGGMVRITAAF